jgi:uncharacterized membrane protein YeaQ/YmgE (transglycosylase-associated protein family)
MNIVLWIAAGGLLGWLAFTQLRFNERRHKAVSVLIGMGGGFLGGQILAPMVGVIAALQGGFSPRALIIALLSAALCLILASKMHDRFGV